MSGDSDVLTLGVTLPSPIQKAKDVIVFAEFSVLNLGKGENVSFNGSVGTYVSFVLYNFEFFLITNCTGF